MMASTQKTTMQKMTIQGFFFRLGLVVAVIVCIFSYSGGYHYPMILARAGMSFLIVYLLGQALTTVWKTVSPPLANQAANQRRAKVDFLIGADKDQEKDKDIDKNENKNENNNIINPNENTDTNENTNTSTNKLKRKEYPGQIAGDMFDGLPDAGKQAELVRKMGWGD